MVWIIFDFVFFVFDVICLISNIIHGSPWAILYAVCAIAMFTAFVAQIIMYKEG